MSNKMYCKIIASLFVAMLVFSFSGKTLAMGEIPKSSMETSPAIDFELLDLQGRVHTLSEYKGKIVFLNFWASWCGPCRAEMPSLQKLYESWDKTRFEMLAVNVGENEDRVKKFARENGYTFPILLDRDSKVAERYLVRGIPITFLVDEDGMIIAKLPGSREWTLEEVQAILSNED
jgi:thiol-disulfide isomerase/thioredoxin